MEERINEIEKEIFFIQMADHLDSSDYRRLDELNAELRTLKGE